MEILKDRVDERVNTAVSEAVSETAAATKRETLVDNINAIMAGLGYTPEQAMDLLHVPQSQRDTYAGLVGGQS